MASQCSRTAMLHSDAYRLFVTDRITGRRFLVDTGSSVSVLRVHNGVPQASQQLIAVNSFAIKTFGHVQKIIDIGQKFSRKVFTGEGSVLHTWCRIFN